MAYTANDACNTIDSYLGLTAERKQIIPNTKNRGVILKLDTGESAVVFIYPLVHKQDDTKTYFDTRDSGPRERANAWNYALENNLKYFCLGVNDQVPKYVNYIFSLECDEKSIEALSGTDGGDRSATTRGNQIIIPNSFTPSKPFERINNQLRTYISVIHKDEIYAYLEKYDNRPYLMDIDLVDIDAQTEDLEFATERLTTGMNTLLYGVPGSGKSWTIEHEYCHKDSVVERLVFHPDYTNADFIGQILPAVDEDKQVTYEFTPGPFTSILRDAHENPKTEYILVIEEINRGNAPAIFGEVFQLLDRKVVVGTDRYPIATSEYGITHKYMADYIYGDLHKKVRIPSNLSILGTMNTSDQNVFTLDTAFQRRWRMRLIENNFDNVRRSLADAKILDTEVTWKKFCDTVNEIITGNKAKMTSAEDKRLGVYFIHENDILFDNRALPSTGYATLLAEYNDLIRHETLGDITDDQKIRLSDIREAVMHNRMFPEKVIKYLWDDAFKFNHEALFDTDNMDSLEKVIRTFVYNKGPERFRIFKATVRSLLLPTSIPAPQTNGE